MSDIQRDKNGNCTGCGWDSTEPHICGIGAVPSIDGIVVPAKSMTRINELLNYADRRGITPGEAAIELINSGLSHLQHPVSTTR